MKLVRTVPGSLVTLMPFQRFLTTLKLEKSLVDVQRSDLALTTTIPIIRKINTLREAILRAVGNEIQSQC